MRGKYFGKCGTCDVCTIVNMKLTSTAVELLLPRKSTLPSSIFRGKRIYVTNVNSPHFINDISAAKVIQ